MAKLVLIDGEGVAELSDGTHWCLAYDQLPKTQRWLNGAEISVTLQLRGSMWPYTLTPQPTGKTVSARPLIGQGPRCPLKGVRPARSIYPGPDLSGDHQHGRGHHNAHRQ